MSTEPQEYTDVTTGVRLTVEYDVPNAPRVTVYWSEDGTSTYEEINEAIHRLLTSAGVSLGNKEQV